VGFITSLGKRVHAAGGVVYHDEAGVDGLIAVNPRAGGHAGRLGPEALFDELASFGLPVVSAGGVRTPEEFARHLKIGYAAVQLGTRFITTAECKASDAYKQAIVDSEEDDIVLTERLTGVPVSVIRNADIDRLGTSVGWFARWMLRGRKTKHWMRTWYAVNSIRRLKKSLMKNDVGTDYWQAGKSVAGIRDVRPAGQIVREFAAALE